MLGLLSSHTAQMENPDEVIRNVTEAAGIIPFRHLGLTPQCGFHTDGNSTVTERSQWDKIALLRKIAETIWPE